MSYAHDRLDEFKIDWITVVLVVLTAAFQLGVLYIVHPALEQSQEVQQSTSASDGGSLLLVVAVEIAVILILWRLYKRLPEGWKDRIKKTLKTLFYPILWVASLFGSHKWLAFNILAFGMGVIVTSVLALNFAPIIVLGVLVAFTVYDHIAVNLSNVMGDLVEMSSNVRLPNFIVIPHSMDFDLQVVRDYINGDLESKPESIAFLIGVGDFVFPALLTGSAFVAGASIPAYGALGGTLLATVVLRDSLERAEEGLPALPWLNTGAVVGFGVGAALSAQPILTVLGL